MMEPERLAAALSRLGNVESVALSGSRTSEINDKDSDYDIYVYHTAPVRNEDRVRIYSDLGLDGKVSISFFEEGDEATDSEGNEFDIMFRSREWTEDEVGYVFRRHGAKLGYTTCILFNIERSRILFDRHGWLSAIQKEISQGYPEELRENIIRDNLAIIDGPSAAPFIRQLELAARRDDAVSQNHRLAAILASYFDALFAFNRVYHPGEKKLVGYAHILCRELPAGFDEDIAKTISSIGTERLLGNTERLIRRLHELTGS